MNGLFDCLNSRRPEHVQYNEAEHIAARNTTRDFICYYGYPAFIYCYRCNMNIFQTLKENVTWLNNCCDYIESLPKQRQACFLTKPTSEALRVTLLSTIALVENLLASGFRYVLVGNFGQDRLERFFGIARHVAGDGGQPKIQQLLFIYRMLSVNNLVRPPKRASVDGDGPQLLFKLQDLFSKEAAPVNHVDSLAILLDDVLLEPTESEEEALADLSPKECILDYLAGYVAQKFSEMCCTDCVESLKGLQRSPSDLILVKSRGYL
ncbi:uncharacterized protein LOC119178075 isoform X1 [Rhipicephalus microplus]|uniref:uncharacterized protein LOC119178075 isoform X1 n=1 Tax=Rhipicephalus microplus TaxID=6941 RepID=UPI003F6B2909